MIKKCMLQAGLICSSSSYSVLSGIVLIIDMAGFNLFLLQLLALRLSTLLDSGHQPSSNQFSLSPTSLASSRSSSVVFTFSCPSFQDPEQP